MTIRLTRAEVERAAFWEHAVCLDCGEEQERRLPGGDQLCDECDSPNVFPASLILACADALSEDAP